ncbi:hypothetical protein [Bradyrhizobium lablabi]|jgi:hypothetical protein|uniref:hypothetical protein n=1 Tax=Bradyrhizobium lablabi TaxID=722472 RepID=UPI0012ABF11A|nr:hypothetical protein [Bradyrhizobium lablabi]
MRIRDAVPEDATAAWEVVRRSIAELCVADHHNDPAGTMAGQQDARIIQIMGIT